MCIDEMNGFVPNKLELLRENANKILGLITTANDDTILVNTTRTLLMLMLSERRDRVSSLGSILLRASDNPVEWLKTRIEFMKKDPYWNKETDIIDLAGLLLSTPDVLIATVNRLKIEFVSWKNEFTMA